MGGALMEMIKRGAKKKVGLRPNLTYGLKQKLYITGRRELEQ